LKTEGVGHSFATRASGNDFLLTRDFLVCGGVAIGALVDGELCLKNQLKYIRNFRGA
jgi:hypothetical protein